VENLMKENEFTACNFGKKNFEKKRKWLFL
jgi:hypothetical protein